MPARLTGWFFLLGIVWLNAYVVRQAFSISFTGQMNSMHGYWIGLARMADWRWLSSTWWPYAMGGQTIELAYPPMLPWLARFLDLPPVFALVYIAGPAALYVMAWSLSGKPGWSFAAAALYSLWSPTELLLPDGAFSWLHVLDPRRLYVTFVWDEAPHQLALALDCLAVAAWRRENRIAATFAIALAALANPFGITTAVLFAMGVLAACPSKRLLKAVAVSGILAWALVYRFYSLEMLQVLRTNAELAPESAWTAASWFGLIIVLSGLGLAKWIASPALRFAVPLLWMTAAIPALFAYWGIVVLQQPGRYKAELEVALALAGAFAIERITRGMGGKARMALAMVGVVLAGRQLVEQRRFSKRSIVASDPASTFEYRTAKWIDANLKGQLVFLPGSLAQWLPAFSSERQFGGGSYPTALNPVQQRISQGLIYETDLQRALLWLRAFGVDAVAVAGPGSGEFWKPYSRDIYGGALPLLFNEQHTPIYRVPRRNASQAHVVAASVLPVTAPKSLEDTAGIVLYVDAVEAHGASIEWRLPHRAEIRTVIGAGQVISVHMNWHRRWRAACGGVPAEVEPDGLGQVVIRPNGAPGETVCELTYGTI